MSARLWACCSPSPLTTKHVSRQYRNQPKLLKFRIIISSAEKLRMPGLSHITQRIGLLLKFAAGRLADRWEIWFFRRTPVQLEPVRMDPFHVTQITGIRGYSHRGGTACLYRHLWIENVANFQVIVPALQQRSIWLLASFRPCHCGRSPIVMKFSTTAISGTVTFNL
jgi:hypothetical protein